jgi:hypothetical protein
MTMLRHFAWLWLAVLALSACTGSDDAKSISPTQKFYFVESLKTVEAAGLQLQDPSLKADELKNVLSNMDEGLKLAFQVEASFLDQLDPRLSKNYQRYFVKGVESYRLGIEAGDSAEQQQGLKLLSQWAVFWSEAKQPVSAKLQAQ